MVKIGNLNISTIKVGSVEVGTIYLSDDMVWSSTPSCEKDIPITFAVVNNILTYGDRTYARVYNRADNSWYILNNINQYEKYGVFAETLDTTMYDGKLAKVGDEEYECSGGTWNSLGELIKKVEYIENTGNTAYVNTNYKVSNNTRVVVKASFNSKADYPVIFGSYITTDGTTGYKCFWNKDNGKINISSIGNTANVQLSINPAVNEAHVYDFNKNKFYYDGTLIKTLTDTAGVCSCGLDLFNLVVDGGTVQSIKIFKGKIYYAKIYENDELVMDLVPYIENGKYCFKDNISGEKFYSANSSLFSGYETYVTPKEYAVIDAPISQYISDDYCGLYDVEGGYVGLRGRALDEGKNYKIGVNKRWEEPETPVITYGGLVFTALEDSVIAMTNYGGNTPNISYSYDGEEWILWDYDELYLNEGDEICFKANNTASAETIYSSFVIEGKVNAKGNMMSMIYNGAYASTSLNKAWTFAHLFEGCTALYNCEDLTLPATTLTRYAYNYMFKNCSNLIHGVKVLPATLLTAGNAYVQMYYGCSSLMECSDMKATKPEGAEMTNKSLIRMYCGCSSIKEAHIKLTAFTEYYAFSVVFSGCSSLELLKLDSKTGFKSYGGGGFANGCSSLKKFDMRYNNSDFATASDWNIGVPGTGVFIIGINATIKYDFGTRGVPVGWTIVYYDNTENKFYLDTDKTQECDEDGNPIN